MILAISPKNNYLNGAKFSQNIFHFESTTIFFKIGEFTKLFHIFVVMQSIPRCILQKRHMSLKNQRNGTKKNHPCKTSDM